MPMSAFAAHAALRAVAAHLAADPKLEPAMTRFAVYLARPIERLGNVAPLKA